MESTSGSIKDTVRNSGSGCTDLLGQSHSLSFPYFRDCKFGFGSDLKPKVNFFFLLVSVGMGFWDVLRVVDFLWVC